MSKIKVEEYESVVLVTTTDRNGRIHYVVCESMDLAKRLFPGQQKNMVPYISKSNVEVED